MVYWGCSYLCVYSLLSILFAIAEDIGFISHCPSITKVQLVAVSAGEFDYSPLYDLPSLEALEIPSMPVAGITAKNFADYAQMKSLRSLKVSDTAEGVSDASELRTLSVDGVKKGCSDMQSLFSGTKLSDLTITNCGIKSLNGLEKEASLESLSLWYDRSLFDTESIRSCAKTLKTLSIMNCPKITDLSFLCELRELEHLDLIGNNEIPCLDFLKAMPKLKHFNLGFNVLDGDLTPCLSVPYVNLEKARKHYNLKDSDLPKNL